MSFSNDSNQITSIYGFNNGNYNLKENSSDSFNESNYFGYNQDSNISSHGNNSPKLDLNKNFEEDNHQNAHFQNEKIEKVYNQVNSNINNPESNMNNTQLNSVSNHPNILNKKTKRNWPRSKYDEDIRIKKFKAYFKNTLFKKLNSEIIKNIIYINLNGEMNFVDGLKMIGKKQTINTNVNENIRLLNTQLKEIFSVEISHKLKKKFPLNYNKLVIEKIYQENLANVTCILDKTFLECLKYFRKDKDVYYNEEYSCLNGIEKDFEDLPTKFRSEGYDDRYINMIIDLINNFEIIYENKMPRKK